MKILYILKHDPWGIGGGSYATKSYLYAFMKIFEGNRIDVLLHPACMQRIPKDIQPLCNFHPVEERSKFSKILSPVSGITHRYQTAAKDYLKNGDYDYVIFDHNSIAGSLISYVPEQTKSIVINHNFEPKYYKDNSRGTLSSLMLPAIRRNEKDSYLKCSYNIFLTEEDMQQFREEYGETRSKCCVIGMFDSSEKGHTATDHEYKYPPTIVISGSLSNVQNIDGINYFINELYPRIPGDWNIIITGKNPSEEITAATGKLDNVKLVPNPDDIEYIVSSGDIYLCPARLGSGIKVRIGDGLRMGLPVIAHEVSARGYGEYIKKNVFFSFDNPDTFYTQLLYIQEQLAQNRINRIAIKQLYHNINSFNVGMNRIISELEIK